MKGLLIVVGLFACALARPDIGLKIRESYNQYQPPATSYGIPTGSYLPSFQTHSSNQHPEIQSFGGQHNGYTAESSFHGPSVANNYHQQLSSNDAYQGVVTNGDSYQGLGDFSSSSSGNQYHQNGYDQQQNYQGQYSGEAQVQKHVYFFDSPEDLPAPQFRISGQSSAPQKNYKIIFIKAPGYKAPEIPQIPVQQQNEEKTLVYVLVKKNEDIQDIVLPTLAPAKQSKPEVFFIKYKTQKDAEAQIQSIQQGQQNGDSAHPVANDVAFVSSIRDNVGGSQGSSSSSSSSILGGHYNQNQQQYQERIHQQGPQQQQTHYQQSASHQLNGLSGSSSQSQQHFGPAGHSGPY